MSKFTKYWGEQFAKPHGIGGKITTLLMSCMNTKMDDAIMQNLPKRGVVLEIGFGNGNGLQKFLQAKKCTFYGIDISEDMVRSASRRNKFYIGNKRLNVVLGNVDTIPFDIQFDCIYTSNTVYFWTDLTAGLLEIRSKLKESGTFINVFRTKEWLEKTGYTEKGYNKYTLTELKIETEKNGFRAKIVPIAKGTYMLISIKK